MSSPKPTILIVHGAWSKPAPAYEPLQRQLQSRGYECHLAENATSGGDEVRGVTWRDDVKNILNVALPLFEQGKEVTVVAHSYGGLPAAIATQGQGVEERATAGKKGGFRQIIYVAAFAVPQKDIDLLAVFGGQWPPWADFTTPYAKNHAIKLHEAAKPVLFGDLPAAEQDAYWEGVVLQSQDAFELPVPFSAADITIPKSYLVCTQDQCVPGPLQEQLAQSLGFAFEKIDAGHFPFLSQPDKTLEILDKMII